MHSLSSFCLSKSALTGFCERNAIMRLSLFGSALTDRFNEDSDIDILVEFDPNAHIGFIRKAAIQIELSALIGRQVDLRTPAELSKHFRRAVLDLAEVQYIR